MSDPAQRLPDPPAPVVEGPAFPPAVKALAGLLMAAVLYYGLRSVDGFVDLPAGRRWPMLFLLFTMAAALLLCWWWIVNSRTSVDPVRIRQTWWSEKEVRLADITQTKLILLPGLTWIVTPRLVVRTRSPGSTVFHAADPLVIAAFARLSIGLPPLPDASP